MSFPLTPPPSSDAGAFTTPRYLQRWLDINPIGPMTRCGTTITLPAFNTTTAFNQVSDIVAAFNFEAPNNFSLKSFVPSSNPNYALCVSYRVGSVVTRYLMWDAVGSAINQGLELYSGQVILKNFRFEVWNTTQGLASQATAITFDTSVLQGVDYRWGVDKALVGNDGQVSDFTTGLSNNEVYYYTIGTPP